MKEINTLSIWKMPKTSLAYKFEVIKEAKLFSQLDDKYIKELATLSSIRYVKKNSYLIFEGEIMDSLFILHIGRMKIFRSSRDGKTITVGILKHGEPILFSSLFIQKPCWATAQAITDCIVLCIKKNLIIPFIENNPKISIIIIDTLANQVNRAYERLRDMVTERAEKRIYKTLYMLYERFGPELLFTAKDIADLSGTTPESTLRIFSIIKKKNIINTSRGKIIIVNPNILSYLIE